MPFVAPYQNLKTQAYYVLAEKVRQGVATFDISDPKDQQLAIEEFMAHKQVDRYRETKAKLTKKDDIRAVLGRSPDRSDALSFRAVFEYVGGDFLIEWI
ncbi:MAG: hypothetical protein JST66_02685 [Bacteroidetes bacterium]|nr:hypothetical protein [Bacteroidota bacterium]